MHTKTDQHISLVVSLVGRFEAFNLIACESGGGGQVVACALEGGEIS